MNNFHNKYSQPVNYFTVVLILVLAVTHFYCDAPRNNPIDPDSSNNNYGSIQGVVQTYSLPFTGIENVSVYWQPADRLVKTDSKGSFSINYIPRVQGPLIFSKVGYKTDTLYIQWSGTSKTISHQVNLNSIPTLDSISIYTTVINQFNQGPTFELNIEASIMDKDGDIDSVKINNQQLGFNKKLDYNITQRFYQGTFIPEDLNVTDLEETIGLNFNVLVFDRFQNVYKIGSGKVTRVIKSEVNLISPSNSDTVGSNPTLEWQRFTPGYQFSYTVEVYTNDFANTQKVFSEENFPSDSISYYIKNSLQAGDYYWDLWVVDKFKNSARTKPATFTVK